MITKTKFRDRSVVLTNFAIIKHRSTKKSQIAVFCSRLKALPQQYHIDDCKMSETSAELLNVSFAN